MIVKNDKDVPEIHLKSPEVKNVVKQVLIGSNDGSHNLAMRYFTIQPKGHTPYHTHTLEHVVRVVEGKGVVIDEEGKEKVLEKGQNLFISKNEKHQFKNPFQQPFGFLCIILGQK